MAALDQKQVDELIEKYRALAEKEQRRVDELEQRNGHLLDSILSSLIVPTSAFGFSYARAYYGESASIWGISIEAMVGMLLTGCAALLGFSSDKGAQVAAKLAHDVANGALAAWSATAGAALGMKKRMEEPVPAPQPSTGATEMSPGSSTAVTHEDIAAIKAATALNPQPAMPQQPPVHTPSVSPAPSSMPIPAPQTISPPPWTAVAVANVPVPMPPMTMPQHSPWNAPPTPNAPRRSLAAARTVGLAEAVSAAWPQMTPQPNPMELSTQFAQESRSVQISQEELEAAAGWRLFIAEQARREQRSI